MLNHDHDHCILIAALHGDLHELHAYISGLQGLVSTSKDQVSLDLSGCEFDQILQPIRARVQACLARIDSTSRA
jgi:hypothetical protein